MHLDRPTSILIDLVRILAALVVTAGHTAVLGVYAGPLPRYAMIGQDAVLTFFVLSGFVIYGTANRPGASFRQYCIARASRLLPVAIVATIFAAIAFALSVHYGARNLNPPRFSVAGPESLFLSLTFMNEHAADYPGALSNPPYWSLCYEAWFYAIFGAWFFLRGAMRVALVAFCALCAGPNILLLLPVWICGVVVAAGRLPFLTQSNARLVACLSFGCFVLFAITGFPLTVNRFLADHGVDIAGLGFSQFFLTDYVEGACLAMLLGSLRWCIVDGFPGMDRIAGPVRMLAGCSFSLYLFHWPMLIALDALGLSGSRNPLSLIVIVAALVAFAWTVSLLLERRIPIMLRTLMDRTADPRTGRTTLAG